ncbi:hypothetical protein [uncultured Kordia sp.]|uniref:hypothetical protein n=1 Tax=uncultured Kordia sp. TaxID=507699 RepID=UPI00260162ED|nr:hypothetical protein [uncultured Kordia sp.]
MKKLLLLLVIATLFISCNTNDDAPISQEVSLLGNWRLVEYLADPGDGSGEYIAITSDKTLTFNSNGEITSNYSLCNMLVIVDPEPSSGTYSTTTGIIDVPNCPNASPLAIRFETSNEGNLIIYYPCIEGCSEKYIKQEEL